MAMLETRDTVLRQARKRRMRLRCPQVCASGAFTKSRNTVLAPAAPSTPCMGLQESGP